MPGVKKLTSERRRLIENARRVLDELQISFKEYFAKAEKSDYLSGRNGKWKGCGFDWLLKEDNLIRTAEGTYDSGTKARGEPEIRRSYNIDELDKINTL
ncbi:MAG TPA: hypothetical protein DEO32_01955 [Ruminococcaceae bacterium]|nr:hypothetical protein [Oscillospiraceae bacterium]